ncbi:MAG TPA: methyltransferase [Eubacteriales bacterium]|nr:methyltransferase [Eubacteriales bacterium]
MTDTVIYPNEKIEDLQVGGLKIIQQTDGYRFTTDAVLLANFVKEVKGKKVVELGSGSAVISTLIAYKSKPKSVSAVEIQPSLYEMSKRTVEMNGQGETIKIFNCDIKTCHEILGGNYDAVVSNPPYIKVGSGLPIENETKAIARQEIKITLSELIETASKLLTSKGSLYLVHQTERLSEIFCEMTKNKIEPKEICFIRPRINQTPNLVLIRGRKNGGLGLKILPDIVIFDDDGKYTKTVADLYGERND